MAVFERAYIGSAGSGRNTQVVRANYNTPETVPLYKASLEIWRTLSAELDFNVMFSTQGELDLVHTLDALEVERDKSLLNRAYGVETEILTPEEIGKRCPLVDLTGGGELPSSGPPSTRPAPSRTTTRSCGATRRRPRRAVWTCTRASRSPESMSATACATASSPTRAPSARARGDRRGGLQLVVASMAGVRLPISTHPLQAFVTEPYAHVLDGLVTSMDLYVYVSQTARGELLVGAEILPYNTYSTRSTFDFLAEAAKRSIQILPFMAKARAMRQWAGLCDMTPDSSPLLGRVRGAALLPDGRDGDLGVQGLPHLRQAHGGADRHGPHARPDRALRARPVRAGPHGARRRQRRHPLRRRRTDSRPGRGLRLDQLIRRAAGAVHEDGGGGEQHDPASQQRERGERLTQDRPAAIDATTGWHWVISDASQASTSRCDHATRKCPIAPGKIVITQMRTQSIPCGGAIEVPEANPAAVRSTAATNITVAMYSKAPIDARARFENSQ